MNEERQVLLLIAGSGCAGHTAAIYAARADLCPLVLEGDEPGGQLSITSEVENFPGFPEGVGGFELVENMKKQAQRFGAVYQYGRIVALELDNGPPYGVLLENGERIICQALILATGARARKLDVPGEAEWFGKGVSSCATCDGAFFRDQVVVVVGGGDSALEEALFLTRFARKVKVIHRRDSLRASKIMRERALRHDKIEFIWNTEVTAVKGDDKLGVVTAVEVITHPDGNPKRRLEAAQGDFEEAGVKAGLVECDGVFLGIGHVPNTDFIPPDTIPLDHEGYIITEPGDYVTQDVKTRLPGIFACGDVVDKRYRQAVTAAGMGCKAALEAEHYLQSVQR